jgi:GNAT superfamily N-acetyltransferase
MIPPLIRDAHLDEAPLLAELGRRTFVETFAADNDPEHLARFLEATYGATQQARELADPAVISLLAFVEGEAAGFAQLRRGHAEPCVAGPEPIELQRIYALRAFHGRGVGAALLQAAMDRARAEGFRTLWLGVWERNDKALAFYARFGFRDVGSHTFMVGSDPQVDRILEVAL